MVINSAKEVKNIFKEDEELEQKGEALPERPALIILDLMKSSLVNEF